MNYIGKSLMYVGLWSVGLLAAGIAIWQFYLFVVFRDARGTFDAQGGGANLWLAIGAAVVACVCVFLGVFRRVNRTEEYHITA